MKPWDKSLMSEVGTHLQAGPSSPMVNKAVCTSVQRSEKVSLVKYHAAQGAALVAHLGDKLDGN